MNSTVYIKQERSENFFDSQLLDKTLSLFLDFVTDCIEVGSTFYDPLCGRCSSRKAIRRRSEEDCFSEDHSPDSTYHSKVAYLGV